MRSQYTSLLPLDAELSQLLQQFSCRVHGQVVVQLLAAAIDQAVHLCPRLFQTAAFPQQTDRLLDLLRSVRLLLEKGYQAILFFFRCVLQVMDDHQGYFALMDIFAVIPLRVFEFLPLQIQQIVLDLEGHAQVLHKSY